MASKEPRVVLVLSDTHCGSKFGLLPPGCLDAEGAEYKLNPVQEWLWDCWGQFQTWSERIIGTDSYDVVINGDTIEGVHHGTVEVIDPDPAQHSTIASALLEPITENAHKLYMVAGTEVHTRSSESHLGKALGAEINRDTRSYCFPNLNLHINNQRVSFNHHIQTSLRPWTQASGLGIALTSERSEALDAGHIPPDVVVRSHRHVYGQFRNKAAMIVVTPCWQAPTRFVRKVKPDAVPCVGGLILDWRHSDEGELPAVHLKAFSPTQPKAANG